MANISGFRSTLKTGLVRPNTFRVDLTFPSFVGSGIEAAALGQFHCKGATLPESNVAQVPVYFQGRAVHVAGEREFQPWTVAIYNENFLIRDTLERWMHGINNLDNNTGIVAPSQYQADLYVSQLDRAGDVIKTYRMLNAFPIQVSPIQLDFEANNQVEIFEVTFSYDYYESSGINLTVSNQ
ncbi:MAG TPA: phage tail protein [Methanosarcina sp.]|nr:phage tail protein [Methanosarcina sp.]